MSKSGGCGDKREVIANRPRSVGRNWEPVEEVEAKPTGGEATWQAGDNVCS